MLVPADPGVYHILHVDRLSSVIADDQLRCDETMSRRRTPGTMIGIDEIKARRARNSLTSHPGLRVSQCVPFYFCPRSVMLFVIHRKNHPNLVYRGGQGPILHLEASLSAVVRWAAANRRRWAFTLSNAGAAYFEDRCDLARLGEINWAAVQATKWAGTGVDPSVQEGKQAEFLVERSVPWGQITRIGVRTQEMRLQVVQALRGADHRPIVEVLPGWYY